MHFDYAVGNPPYQESKNGNNTQIWPKFIEETNKIASRQCMIHPGRWVIPKDSMKKVRQDLVDSGLKSFKFYPCSEDVFSGVSIDGGITITFIKPGNTKINYYVNNDYKGEYFIENKIFPDNYMEEAYNKVFKNISTNMMQYIIGEPGKYGTGGGYNKTLRNDKLKDSSNTMINPIKIWASKGFGKGESKFKWYYIEKEELINPPNIFNSKKVMIDSKGHAIAHGKGNVINNLPQICDKLTTGSGVFFIMPAKDNDRDLKLIKSLFMTKTARYLMCITMNSLHVRGFENIPDYLELAKLLPEDELFTDEWFYKTFDFSEGLINEIETRVSPKIEK